MVGTFSNNKTDPAQALEEMSPLAKAGVVDAGKCEISGRPFQKLKVVFFEGVAYASLGKDCELSLAEDGLPHVYITRIRNKFTMGKIAFKTDNNDREFEERFRAMLPQMDIQMISARYDRTQLHNNNNGNSGRDALVRFSLSFAQLDIPTAEILKKLDEIEHDFSKPAGMLRNSLE